MTDLEHALRALGASLKDRAQVGRGAGSKANADLLGNVGEACVDAADSLAHRWKERNDLAMGTGQDEVQP